MEKFDIKEFNAKQTGGQYTHVTSDGTTITMFGDETGYFEKIYPRDGWFYTYKEFYGNGSLKQEGSCFRKGNYQAGIWKDYDEQGRLTGEINHDKPYHLHLDDILRIIKERKAKFSLTDPFSSITRDADEGKPKWLVQWKEKPQRIETLEIDDASTKAKPGFYPHREDN